jgi:cell wall assembly regulator SMI1
MPAMQDVIDRLEAWHRAHRPELLDELAPPVSDDALREVSLRVGAELPSALVALWKWHDGTKPDCWSGFQFNRQLMSAEAALETMNVMDELLDAGEFDAPWWWHPRWLPFLDNGGGDHVCIDFEGCFGGVPGQVLEFWHDDDDRTIIYPNIAAWLTCFVEALEADIFEDEEGDLHPVDDDEFDDFLAERFPDYPKRFDAHGNPVEDEDDDEDDDD